MLSNLQHQRLCQKLRNVQVGRLWFSWYATLSCRLGSTALALLWIPGWKKSGYQNHVLPITGNQSTRGQAQAHRKTHFKSLLPSPCPQHPKAGPRTAEFNTSVEGKYRMLQCYPPREEYFQNNNLNCHISLTNSRSKLSLIALQRTSVLSQHLPNQIIVEPLTMDLHRFLGCSFYLLCTITWNWLFPSAERAQLEGKCKADSPSLHAHSKSQTVRPQ